jgi:acyl-CoA thioesterase
VAQTSFERATAVESLGGGRFRASVDDSWSNPMGPSGGYLAAISVRALLAHVDPTGARRLRSLALHYVSPSNRGDMRLEVQTIREGRRFARARVRADQGENEVLAGLAALSAPDLPAIAHWAPLPPDVGPAPAADADVVKLDGYKPGTGLWLDQAWSPAGMAKHVRIAPTSGAPTFSGQPLARGEAAAAATWAQLADPQPIDEAVLALVTDFWWPPALGAVTEPALVPTIDTTIHFRADLPPGGLPDQPIHCSFRTVANQSGLIDQDGLLFSAEGTLLAQSRQLAMMSPLGSGP